MTAYPNPASSARIANRTRSRGPNSSPESVKPSLFMIVSQYKICTSSARLERDDRDCFPLDPPIWLCWNLFAADIRNRRVTGSRRMVAYLFRLSRLQRDIAVCPYVRSGILRQRLRNHDKLRAGAYLRYIRSGQVRLLPPHHADNAGAGTFLVRTSRAV